MTVLRWQINTRRCRFSGKVRYFGSIAGNSHHWSTTGSSKIYSASSRGFRVYIHPKRWRANPHLARRLGWKMQWCGVDVAR